MKALLCFSYLLITGCIFIMVFSPNGCSTNNVKVYTPIDSPNDDAYKTFIAQEGIPHFSFEYPSYYELVSYQPMPDFPSTSVLLVGTSVEEEESGSIKHFSIHIAKYFENAKSGLDWRIDDYKSGLRSGLMKELEILEKNRVIVAGAEGWECIVSFTETGVSPFIDLPVREGTTPIISRSLFFEDQDMVWEIYLYSDAATYEQAKEDYEHIVRTFKFLD